MMSLVIFGVILLVSFALPFFTQGSNIGPKDYQAFLWSEYGNGIASFVVIYIIYLLSGGLKISPKIARKINGRIVIKIRKTLINAADLQFSLYRVIPDAEAGAKEKTYEPISLSKNSMPFLEGSVSRETAHNWFRIFSENELTLDKMDKLVFVCTYSSLVFNIRRVFIKTYAPNDIVDGRFKTGPGFEIESP
jgi:hypothetical protein